MVERLVPVLALLAAGLVWRRLEPGGMPHATVRLALNTVNVYLLIPALIVSVLLQAPMDRELALLPVLAALVIGSCLGVSLLTYRALAGRVPPASRGALVLAASFGNGVGIGTPVIVALYGLEAARVPILYTLLGSLPLVWTVGVAVAVRHTGETTGPLWREITRSPPLWAVLAGLAMRASGVAVPTPAVAVLDLLADAAIPVLSFVVGLSLSLGAVRRLGQALPALAIKGVLSPLLALGFGHLLGIEGALLGALVVTAGSASFNVGVVLTDRYALDAELYALCVALSVAVFVSLAPLWAWVVGG